MYEVICKQTFMMFYALVVMAVSALFAGVLAQRAVRQAFTDTLVSPSISWTTPLELLAGMAILLLGFWVSGRCGAALGRNIDDIRSYHWPVKR